MIKLKFKSVIALVILYILGAIMTLFNPEVSEERTQTEIVIEHAKKNNPVLIELMEDNNWN